MQVTLNRPDKLNCIDKATSREIAEIWERFDRDESLWVAVITGTGRAFCTGADLHGRFFVVHPLTLCSLPSFSSSSFLNGKELISGTYLLMNKQNGTT